MEDFDPYSAWLGIPLGSRPPDYYQLLGLPAFQQDPYVISAAADHQMAQVKPHFGGPQASLALRLLNELASAKELLLNPDAKASYDAELQRRQNAGPGCVTPPRKSRLKDVPMLPPGSEFEPETAAPASPPVAMQALPMSAVPAAYAAPQVAAMPQAPVYPQAAYAPQPAMMAMPVGQAAMPYGAPYQQPAPYGYPQPYGQPMPQPEPAVSISRSRVPPPRRNTSSTEMALAMLALCVVGVAGVAGFIVWRMQNAEATQDTETDFAMHNSYPAPIIAPPKKTDTASSQKTSMEDLYPDTYKPTPKATKKNNVARPDKSEPNMLGTPDPRTPMKRPEEMAKVDPPKKVAPPKKPAPAITEPKKAESAMPAKSVDPKEAAAVNKALGTARTAIKNRHFADAEEQLNLAEFDATAPQSLAEIAQVRALLHYNNGFWNAVQESWRGLIAGGELMINGEVVVVVEVLPEKLIIRAAGQNREYTVEKMPAAVALALAENWFKKDDPNSKVFLGAFLCTDAKGDKKKGHDLLNKAAKEGIDVANLLKEVDRK